MRLLNLDPLFFPYFQGLLRDGLTLGPRIADLIDLSTGSLSVWVTDEIKSIEPKDLQTDIFYPVKKDKLKYDIPNFLASILSENTSLILIGETDRFSNELPPVHDTVRFPWLIVSSSVPAYEKFLCVCFVNAVIGWETWDAFRSELKQYPSIILVVDRPSHLLLTPGEFVKLEDTQLKDLLRCTKYILVGIFDEMSMMLWKRNKKY